MFCTNCGYEIKGKNKTCPKCGNILSIAPTSAKKYRVSSLSTTKALILALFGFLGFAGLHRIYVGRTVTGILFALTFGGCLIGTIWDIYQILSNSFKDGDGFPLFSDSAMRPNYYRKSPKKSGGIVAYAICTVISIVCVIDLVSTEITMHNEMTAKNNEFTVIEKAYKNKQFDGLTEKIEEFRKNHPYDKEKELARIEKDIKKQIEKDEKQKIEDKGRKAAKNQVEQNKAQRGQEFIDAYVNMISAPNYDAYGAFESAEYNGAGATVKVNDRWNSMPYSAKKEYLNRIGITWNVNLRMWDFIDKDSKYNFNVFIKSTRGKTLGIWSKEHYEIFE